MHLARSIRTATATLAVLGLLLTAERATAQLSGRSNPADFDILLPQNITKVERGKPEDRVLVTPQGQDSTVALVHFTAGDRSIVVMPDGRLKSFLTRETSATSRPFEPITKEALAKRLTSDQFKGFKTKQTKRFLYIYNASDTFYTGTSKILETMYPALFDYCKRNKIPVREPAAPLVVIMFRTEGEYKAFHEIPDGVVAYYHSVANFTVMYENPTVESGKRLLSDIWQRQVISVVAHEGVHQILFNIGAQQRLSRWPMWISEGLPEYFAATDLGANIRWKGVGIVNDLRMLELQTYIKAAATQVAPGDTVKAIVRARQLDSTGYAISWALVHFLAQKRTDKFLAYLREVSELGPMEAFTPDESEQLFTRHFGDDFPELEQMLLKHLKSLPFNDPFARYRAAGS
jgi:hypothetical protein